MICHSERSEESAVTESDAKELLIDGMNFAAYHETDHSLWDSDKNRLFGSEHFDSGRPVFSPSVWGEGKEFERRMAELLQWAVQLAQPDSPQRKKSFDAFRLLLRGDHYINRVIRRAGFA